MVQNKQAPLPSLYASLILIKEGWRRVSKLALIFETLAMCYTDIHPHNSI